MPKYRKRIAPRLANGNSRISFGHCLPEPIKEGLRKIARKEHKSMSWVMEEIIIDYFGFDRPEYIQTKGNVENEIQPKGRIIPHQFRNNQISKR